MGGLIGRRSSHWLVVEAPHIALDLVQHTLEFLHTLVEFVHNSVPFSMHLTDPLSLQTFFTQPHLLLLCLLDRLIVLRPPKLLSISKLFCNFFLLFPPMPFILLFKISKTLFKGIQLVHDLLDRMLLKLGFQTF